MTIYLFEKRGEKPVFIPKTLRDTRRYGFFNFDGNDFVWRDPNDSLTKGSLSGVVSELFGLSQGEEGVLVCDRKSATTLLRYYPGDFEYMHIGFPIIV